MTSKSQVHVDGGMSANRRFLVMLRPLWVPILSAILSLVFLTGVNMATPILVGTVFTRVFPERNWELLWCILIGLALLFVVRNALFFQSKFAAMKVGEDVCFTLRTRLFRRLQQKSLVYTRAQSPGKLSGRVMNDSFQIQEFIQGVLPSFLQSALLFIGVMIMIYVLNWQLALASTFILPLHVMTYSYFSKRIKNSSRRSREFTDLASNNLIEKLLGVEVVKGFQGEDRENQAFEEAITSSHESQLESLRYIVFQKICADMLVGAGLLCLIGFGAYQVIGRPEEIAMKAGEFIAFFWYIRLLYPTIIDLMSSGGKLARAHVSIERAFELLRDPQGQEETNARLTPEIQGDIEFDQVCYSFGDASPVLTDISFSVKHGAVCAITGPSGAGKTTMVSTLPLLLYPDRGCIRVDGHDTRSIDLDHLRSSIGVVFQECFLFNTSIMENLRYAQPDVSPEQIIEICRYTGADRFISLLPQGYNSVIGENGISLSRGQKQMITLTRAVINNPQILILDEATASLDPSLEAHVIPMILNLMKGRTTLMITHNPKLLEHADCELTIERGCVTGFRDLKESSKETRATIPGKMASMTAAVLAFLLLVLVPHPARAQQQADPFSSSMYTTHRVRLSYTSPERCLQMLQLYGFNVLKVGESVDPGNLPAVVVLPSTTDHNILPKMLEGFPLTDSDPIGDMLVFYHPDRPEQLSLILHRIQHEIDLPARQVMLEAMVLEVSESAMDRLGVDWEVTGVIGDYDTLQLGQVATAALTDNQFLLEADGLLDHFNARVQALIREGEAEVLSRPSVLTLDNRMAFINVSEIIPIPESKYHGNQAISTVDFREKDVGIQLSIRPRITDDGEEVSLQVHANVSAVVPNQDVVVYKDKNEIARSPTISVREVKTYARIANNTPFIIGGLISKDDTLMMDRVPFLGALPFFGRLFRSESNTRLRREVIIVITPFVLPEDEQIASGGSLVGRNLPQDDDDFDSIGNRLFRDAYRIREEDVYELGFLKKNQELTRLQALADDAVTENIVLADQYPYSEFIKGRIPGERLLVYRQIYSVIRRIGLDKEIDDNHLIFFKDEPNRSVGFDVSFLGDYLEQKANEFWSKANPGVEMKERPRSVWEAIGDHAIALIYVSRRNDSDPDQILYEQVPEVRVIDCAGRDEYEKIVWDLNKPDAQGRQRGTIVLHTERDLQRVKQAIVLRETIGLNGTEETMTLLNFNVGRLLLLPSRSPEKIDLIDGEIARLSLITDRYYDLLREQLSEDMDALHKALEEPVE